jgi:hypothetical protein
MSGKMIGGMIRGMILCSVVAICILALGRISGENAKTPVRDQDAEIVYKLLTGQDADFLDYYQRMRIRERSAAIAQTLQVPEGDVLNAVQSGNLKVHYTGPKPSTRPVFPKE